MTKEHQQGVPDGSALQIEAAVIQAQKVLSDWNEWYGLNGCNAPLPPSGIVKAQEMLAEARSLLASAPPAPQAKPQLLSDEQQIAEALRKHGLMLVKTAAGYDVMKLGPCIAHNIGEKK